MTRGIARCPGRPEVASYAKTYSTAKIATMILKATPLSSTRRLQRGCARVL